AEPNSNLIYLYSAYLDKRKSGSPSVRLIVIVKKKTK
ncbi:hypothetical protein FHG87_025894, partial [Trinorchestia longiramus]